MNEEQKKTYLAWLNDAHAMELGLVKVLEKQSKETEGKPINAKIKEHLDETKKHAEMVEECIKRNGGDPSTGKDWLSQAGAVMQGMAASMPSDADVKNVHASYASEHFEIATYTLLAAAALECEDPDTAAVCKDILKEEEAMADYLLKQLPEITKEHIDSLA